MAGDELIRAWIPVDHSVKPFGRAGRTVACASEEHPTIMLDEVEPSNAGRLSWPG